MEIESKQRELPPAGTHTAVCYMLVNYGTQQKDNYYKKDAQGNPTKETNKWFRIGWELSDELMKDGRPFAVGKEYKNNNFSKSNIMKDLNSWIGKPPAGVKLERLILGKACNLTIVHEPSRDSSTIYANITSITPLKKNETPPKQFNATVFFDFADFDQAVFDALPEWMREKIKLSPEYHEAINPQNTAPEPPPHEEAPPFDESELPPIKGEKYAGI